MNDRFFRPVGIASMSIALVFPVSLASSDRAIAPVVTEYQIAQCRTARTANPRGPEDSLIPYVVSLRNTAVSTDRPTLRWNPIAGVTEYKVSLLNGDRVLWAKTATTKEMPYPTDQPALQAGIDYRLVIEAGNGRSSQEEDSQTTFYLLSPSEAATFQATESLFANQPTTEKTTLLKADLYAGARLYAEAIDLLEALVKQGTNSAIVYRELGDLYARSNLHIRAEPNYIKAASLAEGDLTEQARIQESLGELYVAIEQRGEAMKWFTQAKESYEKLGNSLKVNKLQEEVTSLS